MAITDLQSIAFPTLDEFQIGELSRCAAATPKLYRDGEELFAVGERNSKFHVINSGQVEILDHSGEILHVGQGNFAILGWEIPPQLHLDNPQTPMASYGKILRLNSRRLRSKGLGPERSMSRNRIYSKMCLWSRFCRILFWKRQDLYSLFG